MKTKYIAVVTPYHDVFKLHEKDKKKGEEYIWIYDMKSAFGHTFDELILTSHYYLLDDEIVEYVKSNMKKKNKRDWNLTLLVINLLILLFLFILIFLTLKYGILSLKIITIINQIIVVDIYVILVQIVFRKI